MTAEILAKVIRGNTVESIHRGHLIILDCDGNTVASMGDPATITYFRSAAKAFQVIPSITSGAVEAFGFTLEEIAMAAASHSGEQVHVELVKQMLEKIGLTESDLRCGVHLPFNEAEAERLLRTGQTPSQLHNNCSGKHAAMLAQALHIGADISTYESLENRVQKRIVRCVADFTGVLEDEISIGIDGCAAPNFAVSIMAMARSFCKLVNPTGMNEATQDAANRIVSAMIKFPYLIGGTDRLDTLIMQAAPGKVISKVGADGVWLCGVLPCEKWSTGLAIALKVEDGDDTRGRPVVAVEILRQLGILTDEDLVDISPMAIKNRRGDVVGRVESAISLPLH